jgi:hypothetical protein
MPQPTTPYQSFLRRYVLPTLIAATCVRVWMGSPDVVPAARAQIPDSGLQRKQLIESVDRTNALLSEIVDLLKNRGIKLRPGDTDNSRDAGPKAAARPPAGTGS